MLKIRILVLAIVLVAAGSHALAQGDKPAKLNAEQIIAKHLESIGTPQAIAAAKTRVRTFCMAGWSSRTALLPDAEGGPTRKKL